MPYIGTSPSNGVRRVYTYTATASQTTFSGASNEGSTLAYVDNNYLDVYQNGILLGSADYTSTTGTSVVLAQAASVDDIIVIVAYDVFSVADTVSKTDGGTFDGAVTISGAFTSQGIDDNADATALTINSSEEISVGGTPVSGKKLTVEASSDNLFLKQTTGDHGHVLDQDDGDGSLSISRRSSSSDTLRMIFPAGGTIMMHKTNSSSAVEGQAFSPQGNATLTRSGGLCLTVNRNTNDGQLISLRQANSQEGAISVSGTTITYTSFTGSHWSRLTDNSKPTILRGTVVETIDEMCDWYQVQFTVKPTDGTSDYVEKESIALPDGASVGDTISYTHEGITYDDAVIVKEGDEKHTKCKISDTEDSKRVYGVFMDWDNDDDSVNDMYVMAVGTGVVRVSSGETVNAGDLLSSKGDGTAKVQSDDIVRSKTIGKVLTNIKQETYDDGSYTVPCALYCG